MTAVEHVVFGAGAIGRATVEALVARGERVRLVNRSGRAAAPDGVEVIGGDAADPAFTVPVAAGARVVYQALNPPYHRWPEQFPPLQSGVRAAARSAGARLVSTDNPYCYGRPAGRPLDETRPDAAHTVKGRPPAAMAAELLAEHAAGHTEVVIARASDYNGPGAGAQSNLGDRVVGPAWRGRPATVLGDPDQPHTYTYVPDIGATLAALGVADGVTGQVWHVPNDPGTRTTRELAAVVQDLACHPGAGFRRTSPVLMRALALVNPTVHEVWGLRATPIEDALERTVRAARDVSVA